MDSRRVGAWQSGSTLTEFVVIGPLIVLMFMAGIQMMMLQHARLNLDYAAYEAGRAGAKFNANPERIREAWFRGMTPLLVTSGALPGVSLPDDPRLASAAARRTAMLAEAPFMRMEIVNPTKAAFDDFADPELQKILHTGKMRVIPNEDLASRSRDIGIRSGVNIQDANVLKLRVTYGYEPKMPVVKKIFTEGLALMPGLTDPFQVALLASGRIPVVMEATVPMLSAPVENAWVRPTPGGDPDSSGVGEEPGDSGAGNQGGSGEDGGAVDSGSTSGDDDFCTDVTGGSAP